MGSKVRTDAQIKAERERYECQVRETAAKQRMALADKIAMAVVDKIANDIIRPGPKPEERECYVMAQELRDISKELSTLVSEILKIEEELSTLVSEILKIEEKENG